MNPTVLLCLLLAPTQAAEPSPSSDELQAPDELEPDSNDDEEAQPEEAQPETPEPAGEPPPPASEPAAEAEPTAPKRTPTTSSPPEPEPEPEPGLSGAAAGTVIGATGAACCGCLAAPALLGGTGLLAAFVLSSAASPCVSIPGGTGAALYGLGSITAVVTPVCFGPVGAAATTATAAGSSLYAVDNSQTIWALLAGAAPGVALAAVSFVAVGLAALSLPVLALGVGAGGAIAGLALTVTLLGLASALFTGALSPVMVFVGVTAAALARLRLGESDDDGADPALGRQRSALFGAQTRRPAPRGAGRLSGRTAMAY